MGASVSRAYFSRHAILVSQLCSLCCRRQPRFLQGFLALLPCTLPWFVICNQLLLRHVCCRSAHFVTVLIISPCARCSASRLPKPLCTCVFVRAVIWSRINCLFAIGLSCRYMPHEGPCLFMHCLHRIFFLLFLQCFNERPLRLLLFMLAPLLCTICALFRIRGYVYFA